MRVERLYTVTFISEGGFISKTSVKAGNKPEAVNKAFNNLKSWRSKDRVEEIKIEEDKSNPEVSAEDYK